MSDDDALRDNDRLQAALLVAETLLERRDVQREIMLGRNKLLPSESPYWMDLMARERQTRLANDNALAAYRMVRESSGDDALLRDE